MTTKRRKPAALQVSPDDARMIVIAAFRYYLGRKTISVWAFGKWMEANWQNLDEGTRHIIAGELEEAFKADNEERRDPFCQRHLLGYDCDRATWSRVRALYRKPTCTLCGKEMAADVAGSVHLDGEYSCAQCAPLECEVCEKPFKTGETIIPNKKTRRARHPGCKAKEAA